MDDYGPVCKHCGHSSKQSEDFHPRPNYEELWCTFNPVWIKVEPLHWCGQYRHKAVKQAMKTYYKASEWAESSKKANLIREKNKQIKNLKDRLKKEP